MATKKETTKKTAVKKAAAPKKASTKKVAMTHGWSLLRGLSEVVTTMQFGRLAS